MPDSDQYPVPAPGGDQVDPFGHPRPLYDLTGHTVPLGEVRGDTRPFPAEPAGPPVADLDETTRPRPETLLANGHTREIDKETASLSGSLGRLGNPDIVGVVEINTRTGVNSDGTDEWEWGLPIAISKVGPPDDREFGLARLDEWGNPYRYDSDGTLVQGRFYVLDSPPKGDGFVVGRDTDIGRALGLNTNNDISREHFTILPDRGRDGVFVVAHGSNPTQVTAERLDVLKPSPSTGQSIPSGYEVGAVSNRLSFK